MRIHARARSRTNTANDNTVAATLLLPPEPRVVAATLVVVVRPLCDPQQVTLSCKAAATLFFTDTARRRRVNINYCLPETFYIYIPPPPQQYLNITAHNAIRPKHTEPVCPPTPPHTLFRSYPLYLVVVVVVITVYHSPCAHPYTRVYIYELGISEREFAPPSLPSPSLPL